MELIYWLSMVFVSIAVFSVALLFVIYTLIFLMELGQEIVRWLK